MMSPPPKLLLAAYGALGVLGWSAAAEGPSVTEAPRQRTFVLAPSEIRRGPIIFEGQILHRAVDGSWLRLRLRSERGTFVYRVTPLHPEAVKSARLNQASSASRVGVVTARTLRWPELRVT